MKYPKPGTLIDAWFEDDTYERRTGPALVVATSRHALPFSGDPVPLLDEAWKGHETPPVVGFRKEVWSSVTKRELDDGSHAPCEEVVGHEAGSWCGEGQGEAWVRVAYPIFAIDGQGAG
jgi:hypothetical protein